jgi:hypothetical protein
MACSRAAAGGQANDDYEGWPIAAFLEHRREGGAKRQAGRLASWHIIAIDSCIPQPQAREESVAEGMLVAAAQLLAQAVSTGFSLHIVWHHTFAASDFLGSGLLRFLRSGCLAAGLFTCKRPASAACEKN